MTDISHMMGSDLDLSPSGDLLGVDGAQLTQQRVLRRLLTNPGAMIFHLRYGAGLARFVGQVANAARIRGIIARQMKLERGVGAVPAPTVDVSATNTGLVTARVGYADSDGTPTQLAIPL